MHPWAIVLGLFGGVLVLLALTHESDQDTVGISPYDPLHQEWVNFLAAQRQD
jgi:hypothetical protein